MKAAPALRSGDVRVGAGKLLLDFYVFDLQVAGQRDVGDDTHVTAALDAGRVLRLQRGNDRKPNSRNDEDSHSGKLGGRRPRPPLGCESLKRLVCGAPIWQPWRPARSLM